MTDEEFNKLAHKAGIKFDPNWGTCYTGNTQLKEFAELVATAERERIAKQFDSGAVNVRARGQE